MYVGEEKEYDLISVYCPNCGTTHYTDKSSVKSAFGIKFVRCFTQCSRSNPHMVLVVTDKEYISSEKRTINSRYGDKFCDFSIITNRELYRAITMCEEKFDTNEDFVKTRLSVRKEIEAEEKYTPQIVTIDWKKWNPNDRSDIMNMTHDFIKFKDDDKIHVMKVADLAYFGKTTDDIDKIAKIPDSFKVVIN